MRINTEITKQGIGIKSIIKDWAKLRDWELEILVKRDYEEAIAEKEKRIKSQIVRSK